MTDHPGQLAAADQAAAERKERYQKYLNEVLDGLIDMVRNRHPDSDLGCGNKYCVPAEYYTAFESMPERARLLLIRFAIQRFLDLEAKRTNPS